MERENNVLVETVDSKPIEIVSDRTVIPPGTFWDIEWAKRNNLYFYLKEIQEVRPKGRVIVQDHGEMIMLAGYSYLGLNEHPAIKEAAKQAIDNYGIGTEGSRFLAGTLSLHNELEKTISEFKQTEDAITFTSGYVANISTISSLLRRNDLVFSDKMNHASIIDGCIASHAHLYRYHHNDLKDLEKYLTKIKAKVRKLVVVDAVYSMEGTIVDLPRISAICKKTNAYLMVDEAHSVGVLGEKGTGIEEYFNMPRDTIDIKMGTMSKAIPSSGGYIAGNQELITFLKHEARGFLYSGAPSSSSVAAALTAFQILQQEPERIKKLYKRVNFFKNRLLEAGLNLGGSQTPIIPVIFGDFDVTCAISKYCQDKGLFIQGIHPPVIPKGTSRLRATITLNNTMADLDYCANTIIAGARKFHVI